MKFAQGPECIFDGPLYVEAGIRRISNLKAHFEMQSLRGRLVTVRGDWLGAVKTQLHLLSNGKHAFCCIDSDGAHGAGDAGSQHVIHEIYNHPRHRGLREELPSRRRVSTCSLCPMLP